MREDCDKVEEEMILYLREPEFRALPYVSRSWFCRNLLGGFCYTSTKRIYIRWRRRYDQKLICHEREHLEGRKHTWKPFHLMFPSWILRGWKKDV